jgi:hypothetical protein
MGLTIARQMLEAHGGSIAILRDGRRKGAHFLVRLPRKRSRATIYNGKRQTTRGLAAPWPILIKLSASRWSQTLNPEIQRPQRELKSGRKPCPQCHERVYLLCFSVSLWFKCSGPHEAGGSVAVSPVPICRPCGAYGLHPGANRQRRQEQVRPGVPLGFLI